MRLISRLPFAVLLLTAACGGGDLTIPAGGERASVVLVSGDGQTGTPGATLADPLVVQLVDSAGNGVAGRVVSWVVAGGGGATSPERGATDESGLARARWQLGPAAGINTLAAVVQDVGAVGFSATAVTAGGGEPSASQSTVSAEPSSILAGGGVATITVTVRDAAGDPVAGATVTLDATGAGNTLTQPAAATGSDGVATGALESDAPGTKVVSATVNGTVQLDATVEIAVTSTPPGIVMTVLEGDGQSAPAGGAVAVRPAVRVTDENEQPVSGVAVSFVVTGGGGRVDGGAQTTDDNGVARVGGWTLGDTPGTNTLEARAPAASGSPLVFTAEGTGSGSAVDHFVFRTPPGNVKKGERFTVEVAMVDAGGNLVPLSGITITLGLFKQGNEDPSNKEFDGNREVDTQDGIATFPDLAVKKEGVYRLRAVTEDLPQLGPLGPEPPLFSGAFVVAK
jgi:hypothetical protein